MGRVQLSAGSARVAADASTNLRASKSGGKIYLEKFNHQYAHLPDCKGHYKSATGTVSAWEKTHSQCPYL